MDAWSPLLRSLQRCSNLWQSLRHQFAFFHRECKHLYLWRPYQSAKLCLTKKDIFTIIKQQNTRSKDSNSNQNLGLVYLEDEALSPVTREIGKQIFMAVGRQVHKSSPFQHPALRPLKIHKTFLSMQYPFQVFMIHSGRSLAPRKSPSKHFSEYPRITMHSALIRPLALGNFFTIRHIFIYNTTATKIQWNYKERYL